MLDVEQHISEAKLAVTSLVTMYCTKNAGCESDSKVMIIVDKLAATIGSNCAVSDANIDEVNLLEFHYFLLIV